VRPNNTGTPLTSGGFKVDRGGWTSEALNTCGECIYFTKSFTKTTLRIFFNVSVKIRAYPEELLGGSGVQGSVGDVGLLGQVLGALDGRHHPLHRQEGGQVGGVGRDDDQGEEPPHPPYDAAGQRSARTNRNKIITRLQLFRCRGSKQRFTESLRPCFNI